MIESDIGKEKNWIIQTPPNLLSWKPLEWQDLLFSNRFVADEILDWSFKGGYLDFSHLTELKTICITEIYMKKQYKSSIIKNHKIKKEFFFFFDGIPL